MELLKHTALLAAAVLALSMVACATNPVTGESELMLITESQEISMGRSYDEEVISTYGIYDDPQLLNYVESIGQPMAANSHRPHLQWHFRILDTPVINAFAVPGGYIYVTRGLLAHMNSEAELAMVIGHEIGHVTARHSAKAFSRQLLIMGGLLVGSMASETFRKYAPLAAFGAGLLSLQWSRSQERQSDSLGVRYAYNQGYDPRYFDDFFATIDRISADSGGGLQLPNFLSTHPVPANRIKDVSEEGMAVMQAQPRQNLKVDQEEFMAKINGLVYGDDPRQGFVSGNAFVHPEMQFQFTVPSAWRVQNSSRAVLMAPESENAALQLTLSNAATARDAVDEVVADMDLLVINSQQININGLPAYMSLGELEDEDGAYTLELVGIRRGGTTYLFMGYAESQQFPNYRPAMEQSISSFNTYNGTMPRPSRLQVVRVPSQMPVSRFMGMQNVKDVNDFLLINGLRQNDVLPAGRLVKIIQ